MTASDDRTSQLWRAGGQDERVLLQGRRLWLDSFRDMGTHIMKTTVEISDALLEEARKVLAAENTSLLALIERGLRLVLAEHARSEPFTLRPASFKGRGLRPELQRTDWDAIRALAYEGHGG